jgi:hypothetical protein
MNHFVNVLHLHQSMPQQKYVFKYSLSKRDYVCHTEHLYLRICLYYHPPLPLTSTTTTTAMTTFTEQQAA